MARLLALLCLSGTHALGPPSRPLRRQARAVPSRLVTARRAGRAAPTRAAPTMMEEVECDVAVIGGGPAGCTCALYTARTAPARRRLRAPAAAGVVAAARRSGGERHSRAK